MTSGRDSLAERIARRRARIVPPPAVAPEETPEATAPADLLPKPFPSPAGLPAGEGGAGGDKAARLLRARALIRRAERGWKKRLGAASPPAGNGAGERPHRNRRDSPGISSTAPAETPGASPARPEAPFSSEDHDFPLAARYGPDTLLGLREASEEATSRLRIPADRPGVDLSRTLFLDTETSGLVGGTGTFAFLIGIGHVEGDRFRVRQLLMRSPSGERAMLEALAAAAADRRDLVTYNGASFDLPLLETRFTLHGLPNPLAPLRHLDLLPPARRLFKPRHESAQLSVLERELLGVERDDDIPGDRIPQVFFQALRNGWHPAMASVLSHNRYDIRTLAALALQAAERMADDWESDDPAYLHGAGHHFFRRGEPEIAIPLLERALVAGLFGQSRDRCLLDLGEHRRRLGDWPGALRRWRQVSAADARETLDALVWFAKHEEHQRKDPTRALAHVEDALERLPRVPLPPDTAARYRSELGKRAARLGRARLAGGSAG